MDVKNSTTLAPLSTSRLVQSLVISTLLHLESTFQLPNPLPVSLHHFIDETVDPTQTHLGHLAILVKTLPSGLSKHHSIRG